MSKTDDDFSILNEAVHCGLEPAGICRKKPDGSYDFAKSDMIPPDTVIYVEMCEQAENEGIFHKGTDFYYNLLSLQKIFDNFLSSSKCKKLSVEESNALYLLTDYRAVNEAVASDIRQRIIKGMKVSAIDIEALNTYVTTAKRRLKYE